MREILFRAKRKDNGEWVEGNYILQNDSDPNRENYMKPYIQLRNCVNRYEVIPETVGQYTGLTDKNNTKIFEGDIVRNEWCLMSGNSVVKFGEYLGLYMSKEYKQGHYGFYLEHLDPTEKAITRKDMIYFVNKCEVIGNIHDSPQMLE